MENAKRIDNLSEQFEDLKTAILTSIGTTNERDVARAVVRFRKLLDFVRGLGLKDLNFLLHGKHSWDELLKYVDIVEVIDASQLPEEFRYRRGRVGPRPRMFLIKEDRTFYELRMPPDFFHSMSLEWDAFMELPEDTRSIVVDALSDMRVNPGPVRYVREPFHSYFDRWIFDEPGLISKDDEDSDEA